MEYKLIMAVSGFPSLYDRNSATYRDLSTRSAAWRQVAEMVGVPGECFPRWPRAGAPRAAEGSAASRRAAAEVKKKLFILRAGGSFCV